MEKRNNGTSSSTVYAYMQPLSHGQGILGILRRWRWGVKQDLTGTGDSVALFTSSRSYFLKRSALAAGNNYARQRIAQAAAGVLLCA